MRRADHLDRRQAMLVWLKEVAANGEMCPSNNDIADRFDFVSVSEASNLLQVLERARLIVVERFQSSRAVTIVETGASTLMPSNAQIHWRIQGAKGSRPGRHYVRRVSAPVGEGSRGYRGDAPELQRVDREPCPRCGVRRDVGCEHGARPLGLRMSL